jgi:O-antigen/teichoic acid export membrane protein
VSQDLPGIAKRESRSECARGGYPLARQRRLDSPLYGKLAALFFAARRHNYIATLATELSVLALSVLTLKLATQWLGPSAFGEYSVAKRALSVLTFTLACGLGIGLPRYISLSADTGACSLPAGAYLASASLIAAGSLSVFGVLSYAGVIPLGPLLFGTNTTSPLLFIALTIATLGLVMHLICYGYLRGRLWMRLANGLQLANTGCVPLIGLLLARGHALVAIILMGSGVILVSIVCFLSFGLGRHLVGVSSQAIRAATRELLRFGLPRVPGEFALFAFTAIPTFVVAHRTGVRSAGQLSLAISVLQLIGALFSGVGVLLLPQVSRLAAHGDVDKVKQLIKHVLAAALSITALMVLALAVYADAAFSRMFGPGFRESAYLTRCLSWAAFPYVIYLVFRNPLDALSAWPYNSINLWAACSVLVALLCLGVQPVPALAVALTLLGGLSGLSWLRCIRRLT